MIMDIDYLKCLVATMRADGYSYYVACSASGSAKVYFSKFPIKATDLYTYSVTDGMVYTVVFDTYAPAASGSVSTSKEPFLHTSSFSGSFVVPSSDYVFSNAQYSGHSLQPDLTMGEVRSSENLEALCLVFVLAVLVFYILSLFRRR